MLSPELVRTEHIAPLSAKPSGQLLTIDKAVLDEMETQHGALLSAVERANNRAAGVKRWRVCVAGIFETGTPPAACTKNADREADDGRSAAKAWRSRQAEAP